jgi:hypothetical protein
MAVESTRSEADPKTEDALECSECDWRGYEANAERIELVDDDYFECPSCGGVCAHLPIEELDEVIR